MLEKLLTAQIVIAGAPILWREIIGNLFGLVSAFLGMRRTVWAWPIGIVGNVLLFTVFLGGVFGTPQHLDLWGQAGRQVFFAAVSVYGWWRWRSRQQVGEAADGKAIEPSWASWKVRAALVLGMVVLTAVLSTVLARLDSWNPLADGWILAGSILATYGMARGWVEFWLIWIAVDAVGVPLLLKAHLYPSASMYIVYGGLCLYGVFNWARARRRLEGLTAAGAATEPATAR